MTINFLVVLLMGVVLGLLGGGGSILTVPILVYLFKINAVTATAYSLFVVGSAACVGAVKSYRKNNLSLKTGLLFALPGFIGVFASRAYIVPSLPEVIMKTQNLTLTKDSFILMVFSVMMIVASYSMIFGRSTTQDSKPLQNTSLGAIGFIVGVFTGFVGAGGGFILIPVLNTLAGLDVKKAIGTSLFIISFNSLLGFIGDLFNLEPDWIFLAKLTLLAVLGVLVGGYFNSKVPAKFLKKIFGVFILILGAWIIFRQISG